MGIYVGMDVHRKRSQVALLDEGGAQLANRNLPNDPAELTALLGQLDLEPRSPLRPPTAGAGWLICWRSSAWSRTWCIPTAPMAIASARLKDDKVDARTLAHLLRSDLLPEGLDRPPTGA